MTKPAEKALIKAFKEEIHKSYTLGPPKDKDSSRLIDSWVELMKVAEPKKITGTTDWEVTYTYTYVRDTEISEGYGTVNCEKYELTVKIDEHGKVTGNSRNELKGLYSRQMEEDAQGTVLIVK